MKPTIELGRATTPDGADMRLTERDGEFLILLDGGVLMSSRTHGSEEELAGLACTGLGSSPKPRVLVGGLGMGFTLRATLDLLPPSSIVTVAELVPAVLEWNRGPLAALAAHPLNDKRVRVEVADVNALLRANPERFDAILLDVDNGPAAFTSASNSSLYSDAGVAAAHRSLQPGGRLAVWSAFEDPKFEQRLRSHGFLAESNRVRARGRKGSRHTIFVGVKQAARSQR